MLQEQIQSHTERATTKKILNQKHEQMEKIKGNDDSKWNNNQLHKVNEALIILETAKKHQNEVTFTEDE